MGYNDVVVGVEADWVDSCCVSGVLAYVLALYDIGEDDIFIASSRDKLGVVFADIECVDIVVVDVFVVFDHQVTWRIVQTYTAILGPRHTVFAVTVEFDGVDRACVGLYEGLEGWRQLVAGGLSHSSIIIVNTCEPIIADRHIAIS